MAENEHIVEAHVAQHHHNRVEREGACVGGGHIEGPEHNVDKGKEHADDAPVQISGGGLAHTGRLYDALQYVGREGSNKHKQYDS